jgi:hypothetical protein
MGGFTNTATSKANQDGGYGGAPQDSKNEEGNSRTAQQYGSGSGVGA